MAKKIVIREVSKKEVDKHRATWFKLAQENGWESEDFFVQVWIDETGTIKDSVSFQGIKRDYVCDRESDKLLVEGKHYILK